MHQFIKSTFFFVFVSSLIIIAQSTNSKTANFAKLSVQDGLSTQKVPLILQDKYGFMWFGTQDGLNCFDGKSIKVYKNDSVVKSSISSNAVIDLYEDSKGVLWVATIKGLNRFNREKDSFDNFLIREHTNDNVSNAISKCVEGPNGNIYVSTLLDGIQMLNMPSGKFTSVVRDTTDATGYDIVLSLNFENDSTLSYLHTTPYGEKQNLILFNTNTEEKIKYLAPPIERNPLTTNTRNLGICCTISDRDGKIWLGTADGRLLVLNKKTKSFDQFEIAKGSILMSIEKDDSSNFWIASLGSGLIKFNKNTHEKKFYKNELSNTNSLSSNYTFSVYKDRMGIVWVGTTIGLDRFDPFQTSFSTYRNEKNNTNSLSHNKVTNILDVKNEPNKFWIATQNGLNKFDLKTNTSKRYFSDSTNANSNRISTILQSENKLWVGTSGDGLKMFNINTEKFSSILNSPDIHPHIYDLIKTKDNYLWFATSYGLVKYNTENKDIKTFLSMDTTYIDKVFDELAKIRKGNEIITSISKVGDNKDITKKFSINEKEYALLVTMGENGITGIRKDKVLRDFGWIETNNGNKYWTSQKEKTMHIGGGIKNRIVIDVVELTKGDYKLRYKSDDSHSYNGWNKVKPMNSKFWGIQLYKISKNEVEFFKKNLEKIKVGNSLPYNNLRTLFYDNAGMLWIGTFASGFATYDITNNKFETYKADAKNKNSLVDNRVTSFYQDKNGLMWITTKKGLSSFDIKTNKFTNYTVKDGLPTNYITNILQDHKGNYWISSYKGLSKFLPSQNNSPTTVINYDLADGIQGYEYYPHSKFITSDGQILLGGKNGLNSFYPGNINPYPPEIIIQDFELFNKSVSPGEPDSPLKKAIYSTEEINLNYDQNIFGFEFQAIHFSRPSKNIYSYKMEGVDKNWITGKRNYASYTNLDPGKYIFTVKAANSDGVWDDKGKSILINISSPWWQTWWAYLSYAVLLFGGLILFEKSRKNKILTKEREKAQKEREKAQIEQAELRAAAAEAQSELIQAENDRKTKELEEARELQLSMLPKVLPNLPHLDIAVYMKTATEVGGDYYDFHVGMDGTLTAVIGDATGHGLNAGTVVTATKSLFNTHANNPDILFTFSEMTRVLKGMKLRMLAMCLSMVKIKGNQLTISSAGIPPALIYRNKSKEIEEFLIKGMPLGVKIGFPYEVRTTKIYAGDTILLMSDGFPELINKDKEMFGYDKVKSTFEEVTDKEPDEIIEHLKNTGSAWVKDSEPDDDVTFVVIKMKK